MSHLSLGGEACHLQDPPQTQLRAVWVWARQTLAQPLCGSLGLDFSCGKACFFPEQSLSDFCSWIICSLDIVTIGTHMASFQKGKGIGVHHKPPNFVENTVVTKLYQFVLSAPLRSKSS